jgi:hypothetical protein
MGISCDPKEGLCTVFGTFDLQYNTSEFERTREDGTTILDLVPDCRVFIFGYEVTQDIQSVSVQNTTEGNTCSITLSNPRGKYEISKQDLMQKWREDKDILPSYGYNFFRRLAPTEKEKFFDSITTSAFGKKNAAKIKQGMTAATSSYRIPSIGGTFGAPVEIGRAHV